MCDTYMYFEVCMYVQRPRALILSSTTAAGGVVFCTTAAGGVLVVCLLRMLGVRHGDAVPSAVNKNFLKKTTDRHDRDVPFSCVDLLAWCMGL